MVQEHGNTSESVEEMWSELDEKAKELIRIWIRPQFSIFKLLESRQKAVRELASRVLDEGILYRPGLYRINLSYKTEGVEEGIRQTMIVHRSDPSTESEPSKSTTVFLAYTRTVHGDALDGRIRYSQQALHQGKEKHDESFTLEQDSQIAYEKALSFAQALPRVPV